MGEALHEMAEVKYALEDNVKQNFLEPLTHLQAKDLKDVLVIFFSISAESLTICFKVSSQKIGRPSSRFWL